MKRLAIYLLIVLVSLVVLLYLYNTRILESEDPRASAPLGTTFVAVDGESLAYSEIDNGASTMVLFVGGLSAWNGTWQRVIDALNKEDTRFNYVALDLPPFGYSIPDGERDYFRDIQAERILGFVEAKRAENPRLQSVILVAHSYGAGPGAEAVLSDGGVLIKRFVIIDGVLNIDEQKERKTLPAVIEYVFRAVIGIAGHSDWLAANRLESFVYIKDHIDADLAGLYTRSFTVDGTTQKLAAWALDYVNDPQNYASNHSESYKTIYIPVRIIWGAEDTLTPLSLTEVLTASVPQSKLYTLPGVGHIPMIEDYEAFDNALQKALHE